MTLIFLLETESTTYLFNHILVSLIASVQLAYDGDFSCGLIRSCGACLALRGNGFVQILLTF